MKKSNLSENKALKTDFLHILMSDYHPSNRTKKITTENHFVSFRTLQSYMLHKKGTDSSPTSRVYMAQAVNKRIENWQTIQYHSSSVCPLKDNLSVNSFSSKPTISEDIIKVTCSVLIIAEGETFLYLQSGSHLEFISFFSLSSIHFYVTCNGFPLAQSKLVIPSFLTRTIHQKTKLMQISSTNTEVTKIPLS